jgi:hypothetical protein
MNVIKDFKNHLYNSIEKINKIIKKRNTKKIMMNDILYYCQLALGNSWSYDIANSHLKINNILDVSSKSIITAKNEIPYSYFEEINNSILDFIYKKKQLKIVAVDGSYFNFKKCLGKDGFILSHNKEYCNAMVSSLFDVINEIPINYSVFKHMNEADALIDQLKYLNKGDILIMDRKYFSYKLLRILNKHKIKVIFRMKKNFNLNKKLRNNDVIQKMNCNGIKIKFRIISYKIGNKKYYLGTTLFDENIQYLKYLYNKRWKIEISFRHSKYNLSMNNINSKTEDSLKKDILIHHFIFITSSFFQSILQVSVKENYKINTTNMLNVTINYLFYLFLYKKSTEATILKIFKIMNIAKETIVFIKLNRFYYRIRKRPSTKWCILGNRFKFIH